MNDRMLGKKPKKHDDRTLPFAKYLLPPPMPVEVKNSVHVPSWPMYDNDKYGNCTAAGVAHAIQLFSAMIGKPVEPPVQIVDQLYFNIDNNGTPFSPGAPQDQGCAELDVLTFWRNFPIAGVTPYAFAEVNVHNPQEMRAAIHLFGCVYIGVQLPISAQGKNAWSGTPVADDATTAPGSWGGHCVILPDYSPTGYTAVSWGQLLDVAEDFAMAYIDEAYAILPNDWQVAGIDWSSLQSDLRSLSA